MLLAGLPKLGAAGGSGGETWWQGGMLSPKGRARCCLWCRAHHSGLFGNEERGSGLEIESGR